MGARRLTNPTVAEMAGVGSMTVSRIRNGDPNVGYMTLKRVVEALGLTMAEVSRDEKRALSQGTACFDSSRSKDARLPEDS